MLIAVLTLLVSMNAGTGTTTSGDVAAELEMAIVLDDPVLLAGEAISGEVIIRNNGDDPVHLLGIQGHVFRGLAFRLKGPKSEVSISPYESRGLFHTAETGRRLRTVVPPGGHINELFFLLVRRAGPYPPNSRTHPLTIFTYCSGDYEIEARIGFEDEDGGRIALQSNIAEVAVVDGKGYAGYYVAWNRCELIRPFRLYMDSFREALDEAEGLGDYRRAAEKLTAYQHGPGLDIMIRTRAVDPDRSQAHVLGAIRGGLVGDSGWAARRWRNALLLMAAESYGIDPGIAPAEMAAARRVLDGIPEAERYSIVPGSRD